MELRLNDTRDASDMTKFIVGKSLPKAVFLAATLLASPVLAQAQDSATDREIERYRAMLADPMANPGYLNADRGESLWALPRGALKVSLESCDLGQGSGQLQNAATTLPKFFADSDKVMDLEQRLLWCMDTIQGVDTADIKARRFGATGKNSDMEDLVAFIASKSNGLPTSQPLAHPKEREMFAIGEALFYRRAGPMDFSCATCHAQQGKRIRLQALPDFSMPGKDARDSSASWPAYRVSQSQTRTMQHRLSDCFRQMRLPAPEYASDGVTALTVYLAKMGEGAVLNAPNIKR